MAVFTDRVKNAWNAFKGVDSYQREFHPVEIGASYGYRPDRIYTGGGSEKTTITSLYNRIAIDVAGVKIKHVRMNLQGSYQEDINSELHKCLTLRANIDQTAQAFIIDLVMSMFDEGSVAIVPVETTKNPMVTNSFDIMNLRVGQIVEWYPQHIKVRVYNERNGQKEELILPKNVVAVVENPLYSVMNLPNSTYKRLVSKLNILDAIDKQSGAGKLDIIIQLPYAIRGDARKKQAEERRESIEEQLSNSKYGIAHIDATERITQLNRPAENNLMGQIQYLTAQLYNQFGVTESVFNGTASESEMLNYHTRTLTPILRAIVDPMNASFLTKTAKSQGQSIIFVRDPFELTPANELAEMADKFTRNEILTPNEVRSIIGYRPAEDKSADDLRNRNIRRPDNEGETVAEKPTEGMTNET